MVRVGHTLYGTDDVRQNLRLLRKEHQRDIFLHKMKTNRGSGKWYGVLVVVRRHLCLRITFSRNKSVFYKVVYIHVQENCWVTQNYVSMLCLVFGLHVILIQNIFYFNYHSKNYWVCMNKCRNIWSYWCLSVYFSPKSSERFLSLKVDISWFKKHWIGLQLDWPWIAGWAYTGSFAVAVQIQNQDHFWISHQKNQGSFF